MRLSFFGPGHPIRGGIARATTELVRSLGDRGHDVRFLTPRRQYPEWIYPGGSDRDPDACDPLDCAEAVLDPLNPISWRGARRSAEEHGADVWVLPYWTWAWAGLWWSLLGSNRRPPVVAVVHNPADHDAHLLQRAAARRVLGGCDGLFTHARVLAGGLESSYPSVPVGFHPLPAVGVPSGPARGDARSALELPADRRVALFLGLIRPYKGVDLLIEAAADLPADSDWLVLVAGEPWGDLGERLVQKVADLRLEGRVRLHLRWVPEVEVPAYVAASDVLILPYRRGSQSAVAPMALAHGRPVLSTAVGGVPEVVRDGVNGVIVPPGDPAAITAALGTLTVERLEELAAGARRSATGLTWTGYAAAFEDLLDGVVEPTEPGQSKTPARLRGRRI
jgi:glycosyltransferase involved in cell wall biosynthesis